MAPEVLKCPLKTFPDENKQDSSLHYGGSVDTWAVGVLAYELLTGARQALACLAAGWLLAGCWVHELVACVQEWHHCCCCCCCCCFWQPLQPSMAVALSQEERIARWLHLQRYLAHVHPTTWHVSTCAPHHCTPRAPFCTSHT
jgi:hypothetical protein